MSFLLNIPTMSVYDTAFVNTELSKPTSIFGLWLWVVIGILVGSLIVLTLFLLSLCLTSRHRSKAHNAQPKPTTDSPTPVILKEIQEIVHGLHVEIGKLDHRAVVYSDRASSRESKGTLNSGCETTSYRSGKVVGLEVSHLGWGRWYTPRELEEMFIVQFKPE